MQKRTIPVVIAAILALTVAAAALGAFPLPWEGTSTSVADPRDEMNADNARKILRSPDAPSFALPVEAPPGMTYLTTVRTTSERFELWIQHQGFSYALCDSDDDPDAACDEPTAHVVREQVVDGRRVRVAEIQEGDGDLKSGDAATAGQRALALSYWQTVEIRRGTPVWVSGMSQGPGTTSQGK